MKKIISLVFVLCSTIFAYAAILEPTVTQNTDFQITNVVTYDNMSADNLFNEVRLVMSRMTGDGKSESIIDYSNFETKTIVIKTKLYVGRSKNIPLNNIWWNVYLNAQTTIKIKDNKLQVKSNFADYTFDFSNGGKTFNIPFYECYPEWHMNDKNKKKQYDIKAMYWENSYEKAIKPNTENVINNYHNGICTALNNITVEDDF